MYATAVQSEPLLELSIKGKACANLLSQMCPSIYLSLQSIAIRPAFKESEWLVLTE